LMLTCGYQPLARNGHLFWLTYSSFHPLRYNTLGLLPQETPEIFLNQKYQISRSHVGWGHTMGKPNGKLLFFLCIHSIKFTQDIKYICNLLILSCSRNWRYSVVFVTEISCDFVVNYRHT
jgi:hypothetical protein